MRTILDIADLFSGLILPEAFAELDTEHRKRSVLS